jgi:hypothetical protein
MDIPVLIQPVPGKGFVARAASPFDWTAEGSTADEALANLQVEATRHLSNGAKAAVIAVPSEPPAPDPLAVARAKGMVIEAPPGDHPLLKWAGTWDPNDPFIQEWQRAIEEHRRQIDNDPDVL